MHFERFVCLIDFDPTGIKTIFLVASALSSANVTGKVRSDTVRPSPPIGIVIIAAPFHLV
jgi:hypothetical protein